MNITCSLFLAFGLVMAGIGRSVAADPVRTTDHDYDPPAPGSYVLPVVKAAGDGNVLNAQGQPMHLRDLTRDRITVMSFIYTRCAAAKACPYATGVLKQLHRLSADQPALAKDLRLISMSFDPGSDTPARMATFSEMATDRTSATPWHFLTTSSTRELQPILDAYGQAVDKKKSATDPTGPLNHTLRVFLIDPNGNIRNIYSSDTLDLRLVLADIRTLQMEAEAESGKRKAKSENARPNQ